MYLLKPDELTKELAVLSGWVKGQDGKYLEKQYKFDNFSAAIEFMNKAAKKIDKMDHHPEWTNVYNRLQVKLSTHEAGGVTELDIKLAKILDLEFYSLT